MHYATIKTHDIANGPGVRVSLFVSGCTHHCKGCFNPETWSFHYGQIYTPEAEEQIMQALEPWYIRGLSLLGGEPFEVQNQLTVKNLARRVRQTYPDKTIWCYTGYDYEQDILAGHLGDWSVTEELLHCLDVLVDGEFIEAQKDLKLRFRGSSNQRVIDVQKSLAQDRVVLWEEAYQYERP
ncbi:MAG: anaerobic ribonucleoside-triphosphate reductase activating protein [Oscillospiraceae bacterium]|nr:anaerobic ribonucleoside-triphosphate reductase activating protein [Oscillospiraceae bacterium]